MNLKLSLMYPRAGVGIISSAKRLYKSSFDDLGDWRSSSQMMAFAHFTSR